MDMLTQVQGVKVAGLCAQWRNQMHRTFPVLLSLLLTAFSTFANAVEAVDLLLILASDVSRSVDHKKFQLQREGYAAAFADKRVIDAITAGLSRRIAVAFVEWSGV